MSELLADAYARFPAEDAPTEEELGEVEIVGEEEFHGVMKHTIVAMAA